MADTIQKRLMGWAGAFVLLYGAILTLSPAVRMRSWAADYRWSHWIAVAVWFAAFAVLSYAVRQRIPDRDPYLLPAASLLCGWGLLTVWRLDPTFGLRQTAWLAVSAAAFTYGLRRLPGPAVLRQYKYLLLGAGLALTALTLIFGTNPTGLGPRLWLGCCGVYLQPSEPLKLLLLIYLAAYLADHLPTRTVTFPLILPTALVVGLALLILLVQQDLGTASLFIVLYAVMLYIATDRPRVLVAALLGLGAALLLGYAFFPVIQVRVEAWLNPWLDPSGNSYQIVQSLIAIANGGFLGRGPGLGSPGLVPIAHSDFIFSAVAEETGLSGTVALVCVLSLIAARGFRASLRAVDRFQRFLAAGISAYLALQSLVIIGGGLRLVPLTGVTLPFLSYGGSSLLTALAAVFLLLLIGENGEQEPAALEAPRGYAALGGGIAAALLAVALTAGWWSVVRGSDLLTRTDNARRAIAERYVRRGALLDRDDNEIDVSLGDIGSYRRVYRYPALSSVVGFTNPGFGQAGLESSLDGFLRGLQGHPASVVWWNQLVFGMPPSGIDVRLSLDLGLQALADEGLGQHAGAVVLLGASSGEVLVMASHPTFDAASLDEQGSQLAQDPTAPLLNRATQGAYVAGDSVLPILLASGVDAENPAAVMRALERFGLLSAPSLRAPVAAPQIPERPVDLRVSPLQLSLAAAALSNNGTVPAPRIALAARSEQQGWLVLPALAEPIPAVTQAAAAAAANANLVPSRPYWQYLATAGQATEPITWLLIGTAPDWQGTPLVCVVVVEGDNRRLAIAIGQGLIEASLGS